MFACAGMRESLSLCVYTRTVVTVFAYEKHILHVYMQKEKGLVCVCWGVVCHGRKCVAEKHHGAFHRSSSHREITKHDVTMHSAAQQVAPGF